VAFQKKKCRIRCRLQRKKGYAVLFSSAEAAGEEEKHSHRDYITTNGWLLKGYNRLTSGTAIRGCNSPAPPALCLVVVVVILNSLQ
jgi:hypothetical protein